MLAIQYLEDAPELSALNPTEVAARLRATCELLPIDAVLVGWNLPPALLDACASETARAGARLFRWHPLLTGDASDPPPRDWWTVGLGGEPVLGHQGMPEFTFVCPCRPAARDWALGRLRDAARAGAYVGVFLDRVRFPSPAEDPLGALACFCDDCRRAAAAAGYDLVALRASSARILSDASRWQGAIHALVGSPPDSEDDPDAAALHALIDVRCALITSFVAEAAAVARAEGLDVTLDCFSPALARMVGQDLGALDGYAAWVKPMSYLHALGPAGLPFELLGLADWLVQRHGVPERDALDVLAQAVALPLPGSMAQLRRVGLPSEALAVEIRRGRADGIRRLLAGVELVEIPGVAELSLEQVERNLRAARDAGADGLALSWDLLFMPHERLELVRKVWIERE